VQLITATLHCLALCMNSTRKRQGFLSHHFMFKFVINFKHCTFIFVHEDKKFHTLATLPQGKELAVSIRYEAGWTPQLAWIMRKRRQICSPPQILCRPTHSPVWKREFFLLPSAPSLILNNYRGWGGYSPRWAKLIPLSNAKGKKNAQSYTSILPTCHT
jgi:hypothetical protein